jgi:hypothetical protein
LSSIIVFVCMNIALLANSQRHQCRQTGFEEAVKEPEPQDGRGW